jgi:hypothetical protein
MPELRQLDWWEVLQPGDVYRFTDSFDWLPSHTSTGWTVDDFFFYCKEMDLTVLVYRPTKLSPQGTS